MIAFLLLGDGTFFNLSSQISLSLTWAKFLIVYAVIYIMGKNKVYPRLRLIKATNKT